MSEKILLDTDIGSDIDDAVCLAYLLAQPHCELLGITTVSGEAEKRASLASVLCKVAGKAVPIYPGAEEPLLVAQRQPQAQQAVALTKWEHDSHFPKGEAIEFLRQTIRANPGEVTLLTIGPLTNIALLFRTDPEIPRLLKRLVMMCGVFTNRLAGVGPVEWNAICDPHAAAIVYNTAVKQHRSIGLDVTCQVRLEAEQVRNKFQRPLLRPVLDFAEVWFKNTPVITFHDPLAATTIFDERQQICRFQKGQVEVELASPRLQGLTYWQEQSSLTGEALHEVALKVDPANFFEHYFAVFEGK
jgi:inosine-uridine nucleoside N-ribohydrolase